jgi:hypothetical protein
MVIIPMELLDFLLKPVKAYRPWHARGHRFDPVILHYF